MTKQNIFNVTEIIGLLKHWKKEHTIEEGSDFDLAYNCGVSDGVEFALHLLEREGD